jgi:light-regulated signal transduction histidine kinase (bacteriophytochrome)
MGIGQILHGLRSDRIQFPVEIALSPVKIDGEFQTIAIIRDVTRRQQAEQKINHLNNDLSEKVRELSVLNEQLEAFNYSVSHDLRAPIRAINGFSKIVLEDYDERLDDTGRNYLQRIRGNCIHMDAMIDALLQLSRISNATLVVTEINLTEIATGIINELREQSPERRVKVDIEPGVTTYGDKELMAIALYNMLSNAWKYTRKREIAGISFGKEQRADEMIYYVSDNGVGFDQANSRRIFLPFARLHSADEFEGIGVGMSTVQRIIQRHGGRIWAHGKRDRGASFCFTLNAAINESTSTAAESTNSL